MGGLGGLAPKTIWAWFLLTMPVPLGGDENINPWDAHNTLALDIQDIQGPITKARA